MAAQPLLGPPELYLPLQKSQPTASGDPFVNAMVTNFNDLAKMDPHLPPMCFTENMSATFLSSGDPCLDFFFHVVPDTPPLSLTRRLQLAWNHNPLMALKLICNLRGVRGTGKSDKNGYYTAALWLHRFHPKTLAGNVPSLAGFGYFKDLPELLYRILEGDDVRKNQKSQWLERKRGGCKRRRPCFSRFRTGGGRGGGYGRGGGGGGYGGYGRGAGYVGGAGYGRYVGGAGYGGYVGGAGYGGYVGGAGYGGYVGGAGYGGYVGGAGYGGYGGGAGYAGYGGGAGYGGYAGHAEHEYLRKEKEKKMKTKTKLKKPVQSSTDSEGKIAKAMERSRIEKEKASAERKGRKVSMGKKALERYQSDPNFQRLYDRISEFFADCLKSDLQCLSSGVLNKISLAAKWCPSVDSSFDRSTLLCESIARKVFPRESDPEYDGIEEAHYAYRVRDRLRKQVLVPLRKALELPEVYIGANQWGSIPYNRVASVAMKNYKDKFVKHDGERFNQYLEDVRAGKTKIAAGALLPHEIINSLDEEAGKEVAELQWKRMVDDLLKKGKLSNCIAVCDVSGSMNGIPMEVCVALGLLVSELSEDPWKGKVITFSAEPQLHLIEGDSLSSKTHFIKQMDWGMNTDFQKVFDRILRVAEDGKLKDEQIVKRVFVFSDMEFDEASANSWETDYQVIVRKFREKGYGSAVPQIVFWNLRDSRATPVPATQEGVALVSGFSKNLMNLFLNSDGVIQPVAVMEEAISGEEYQKLVILD